MLGSGTANDPYQIFTRADLEAVNNNLTAHYKLMNDIDLSGQNWKPLGYFSGTFDGNGKKILNMYVSEIGTNTRGGLFQIVNGGGKVFKLGVENAYVENDYSQPAIMVGSSSNGHFEECYVTGTVKQLASGKSYMGGFSGNGASGSTYTDCYAIVDLIPYSDTNMVGGFIGYATSTSGKRDTIFTRCFSFGTMVGTTSKDYGGFIGKLATNSSYHPVFINSSFDSTKFGSTNFVFNGLTAYTTDEIFTGSLIVNDKWNYVDGKYPTLKAFEEQIVVIIEDRNVLSYVDNINSDIMLNKVATVKRVSSIKEFSADTQKIIKAIKVGTTFVKDIVSGVSREIQVVKVGRETVTSYILPITTNVETMKRRVQILDETVTSYIKPITSDVQREIKSLKQSLSFIDVIVGRVITPNLTPKQIKAIVSHIENGTLAHYLNSQYNVSMLTDLSVQSRIENSSSVNALENQTLSEVRE